MCGEGRDVPAFGVEFELMVAGCEIECAEYSGAFQICDKFIKRRHQLGAFLFSELCLPPAYQRRDEFLPISSVLQRLD